jgi:hypothetical protein
MNVIRKSVSVSTEGTNGTKAIKGTKCTKRAKGAKGAKADLEPDRPVRSGPVRPGQSSQTGRSSPVFYRFFSIFLSDNTHLFDSY